MLPGLYRDVLKAPADNVRLGTPARSKEREGDRLRGKEELTASGGGAGLVSIVFESSFSFDSEQDHTATKPSTTTGAPWTETNGAKPDAIVAESGERRLGCLQQSPPKTRLSKGWT